jgi:hypothetical protein
MLGKLRVAITTGSMNRLASLRQALPTWLALVEVDKIIIVDWGSTVPLSLALGDFSDPRILIVRATDRCHWQNAKCHNLEAQLAVRSDLLLRLDNDTLVSREFFARHTYQSGGFHAVNWRTVPLEVDDKRNLAGTLFIATRDLMRVGGYNERLTSYGREDDDLHARLTIAGYRWRQVDIATLEHIRHSDESRLEHLSLDLEALKVSAQEKIWGSPSLTKQMLISMNERIIAEQPWTKDDTMTAWDVKMVDDRYWVCQEHKP